MFYKRVEFSHPNNFIILLTCVNLHYNKPVLNPGLIIIPKYIFSLCHSCFSQDGVQHSHAFIYSPEACRFCDVEQNLDGNLSHSQRHKDGEK